MRNANANRKLPSKSYFLLYRILSLVMYLKADNLNSLSLSQYFLGLVNKFQAALETKISPALRRGDSLCPGITQ